MTGKTNRHYLFDVQLNWLSDHRGVLSSNNVAGAIHVATPKQFGGEGREWSPEHLFLSSICSCFMSTYLAFAKKLQFSITHLDCNAIGQVELVDGKLKFTKVDLYPKIYIADESLRIKATQALEKTHTYCLVSNSINAEIIYHGEILPEPHPAVNYN